MKRERSFAPAELEELTETSEEPETELWDRAKSHNYSGPEWDLLTVQLSGYAIHVLSGMTTSGAIYAEVARRGRPVPRDENYPPAPADVHDLVMDTVPRALSRLLTLARDGAGWDRDRGATLKP